MKVDYRKYWIKTRKVLLGPQSREVLVFLFFLAISFSFWLLQTLNETFEVEVSVPLRLDNVPDNVRITTPFSSDVKVVIRDKGSALIRYVLHQELVPITLDFEKFDNGATSARAQVSMAEIQRMIQQQLDATSYIQSIRPDTLEFYYNRGLAYRLPVRVAGDITTSPQNYLQGLQIVPDSVTVYAPTAMLDTMKYAYTQAIMLSNLSETQSRSVRLFPHKGVKYEPEVVEVTAQVGYYTEKTVEVPVIGLNFPGDKELRTFPSKAKLTFRVGSEYFQEITAENFVLAITYEELLQNPSPKFRLHLKSLPPGVTNVRIVPQEVDYLIERIEHDDQE